MQLIFAGGEHAPFTLPEGVTSIGAAADADVMLAQPGITPVHARIERRGDRVQVQPCAEPVRLNGHPLREAMVLKSGDTLEFASVRCRVIEDQIENGDRNTRIRSTVPRYVLRGVSGPTFGRNFGLDGTITLGRQADCEVCIPLGEISRKHARLKPTADGVLVEDLHSANGTYINGKRVRGGVLKPGDELALDTVRFMLLAPAAEATATAAPPTRRSHLLRIGALAALAIVVALLIAKSLGVF
ncbi:MAG TPA: FHA domain-containing protein [Rhodanobacteraceae bacterium]|nr:FHA domain-containing protein [Rhodanobacteraceae bacterium]